MPKPKQELSERDRLYATRPTDFGYRGKHIERAVTGGYTRPPRDETLVRPAVAAAGRLLDLLVEERHQTLKPARGSVRLSNYHAIDPGKVENTMLRSLAGDFKARRKARLAKLHARRAK